MKQLNFVQIDTNMDLPEDTISHMCWISDD